MRQNCVWVSPEEGRVSSGLLQGQGLWVQQAWVWHKPSWKRSPLSVPQSHRNLHRTGKQTLEGHKQNLVHQDPGERSSDPTRDGPRLAGKCPRVSSGGVGQGWPTSGLGALSVTVYPWGLLKEAFITSTIVWPQTKQQRGNTAPPINRKLY